MLDERDTASLSQFLLGDEEATAFVVSLFTVLHCWDGLVDKDRPVADAEIDAAFTAALVDLPTNPFYQRHFGQLQPLMSVALANWKAANRLEESGDNAVLQIAFVIRSDYCSLVLKAMELVGGRDHMLTHSALVRQWFHSEGFEAYRAALLRERAQRSKVNHALARAFEGDA
jgi:hypothetical protein